MSIKNWTMDQDIEGYWGGINEEVLQSERIMDVYVPRPQLGMPFKMKIRPGCYKLEEALREENIPNPERLHIESDEILVFRNDKSRKIRKEIKEFLKMKDIMENNGYLHKRGIILYGPPASGKTVFIKTEINRMVDEGHTIFLGRSPWTISRSLQTFRKMEPERTVIVVMEDIDETIRSYGEQEILEMMDGLETVNNVLFIATTNDMEALSPKMKRCGRFDRKIEIPYPEFTTRLEYLQKKLSKKMMYESIKKVAHDTENMGFGHLKEITVSVLGYGINAFEATQRVRKDILIEQKSNRKINRDDRRSPLE